MDDFLFYLELGFKHVMDLAAYDHILFLAALAIPFTFKRWKGALLLATLFTVAHCTSLALSVYGIVVLDTALIEFLIPVTIALTALFNILIAKGAPEEENLFLPTIAVVFFGLIHGFGFSNYFKMLMAEEEDKITPLLGFASGIEIAQVTILITMLTLVYLFTTVLKVQQMFFIVGASILILLVTIPMLIATFPW